MEVSKQIITFSKKFCIKFIYICLKKKRKLFVLTCVHQLIHIKCSFTAKVVKFIKFIHFIKLLRQNKIKIALSSF